MLKISVVVVRAFLQPRSRLAARLLVLRPQRRWQQLVAPGRFEHTREAVCPISEGVAQEDSAKLRHVAVQEQLC